MSVVLVCFPGAPNVSEDAQQKDRELNSLLEKRVQGISAEHYSHIREFLNLFVIYCRNFREKR